MCLALLALGQHPRFPLVLVANRDEFFHRPAAPLGWWSPSGSDNPVLAGRDLSAGGTWFGLSMRGRLALLTNVRDPGQMRADAPSRGRIVTDWLTTETPLEALRRDWRAADFNGFNLITGELRGDGPAAQWGWTSNTDAGTATLEQGLHGLSNASLDTPWPKVERLRQAVRQALQRAADDTPTLLSALFTALMDDERAPDAQLPSTGVSLALERALSSVFIRMEERQYGTRCSTVLLRTQEGTTHLLERTYGDAGDTFRGVTLPNWPAASSAALPPVLQWALPAQGPGTTSPSTFRNFSAF